MVKAIHSLKEFQSETSVPGLVVVDFFANWCGPCRQIAPFIESLASKYPTVKFLKVDVDENEDVAAPRNISSIPTFHFIVNGKVLAEMQGADAQGIERHIQELLNKAAPQKEPKDMTLKELIAVIRDNNLADKAVGFNEKAEFVKLVEDFYASKK